MALAGLILGSVIGIVTALIAVLFGATSLLGGLGVYLAISLATPALLALPRLPAMALRARAMN